MRFILKNEEYKQAREYFQKVIKLDPYHEQAMLNLANIAGQEENKAEELHYLMEAFCLNPYCISVEAAIGLMDELSMLEDFLQRFRELELGKKNMIGRFYTTPWLIFMESLVT